MKAVLLCAATAVRSAGFVSIPLIGHAFRQATGTTPGFGRKNVAG